MNRHPHVLAGIWYAGLGFLISAGLFLPPALRRGGWALFLFVLLPSVASGLSGALVGVSDLRKRSSMWTGILVGMLRGLGVVLLSLIIFAPVFAGGYAVASWAGQPGFGVLFNPGDVLELSYVVFAFALLAISPVIFPAGALGGGVLFASRWRFKQVLQEDVSSP